MALRSLTCFFNGVIGYNRGLVDELGRLFTLVLSILIATSKTAYFSIFDFKKT